MSTHIGEWSSRFFRCLESAGGTAAITVVLGTGGGTILNCAIQVELKEREFLQEFIQARSRENITAYQDYLIQGRTVVEEAYQLVGDAVVSVDNIIELTGRPFARREYAGDQRRLLDQQIMNTKRAYNASKREWQTRWHVVTLQLDYYHQGPPAVGDQWKQVVDAVDVLRECGEGWLLQHEGDGVETGSVCSTQRAHVLSSLDAMTVVLREVRRFTWTGLGTVAEARKLLDEALSLWRRGS